MAVNKVVYGGNTLIDLSDSTVTPETLLEGEKAYNAAGEFIIGTATFQSPNRILYYENSPYVDVPAGTYVPGCFVPKPLLESGFTIVDDDGNNIPYETDGGTMPKLSLVAPQQVRFVMPLTNCRFVASS